MAGAYALTMDPPKGNSGKRSFTHTWSWSKKNILGVPLHKHLLYSLSKNADKVGWRKEPINYSGFTELRVSSPGGNTVYRASESYYGGPWYDWALIEDPLTAKHYIGRLLGFVRYREPGYPTYKLTDLEELEREDIIERKLADETTYAIILPSVKYVVSAPSKKSDEITIHDALCTRFQLQKEDDAMFFPITCIKKPLMVVSDFAAKNSRTYIHVLPQREWSNLFRYKIDELKEKE